MNEITLHGQAVSRYNAELDRLANADARRTTSKTSRLPLPESCYYRVSKKISRSAQNARPILKRDRLP